jgi:hypothetical protein
MSVAKNAALLAFALLAASCAKTEGSAPATSGNPDGVGAPVANPHPVRRDRDTELGYQGLQVPMTIDALLRTLKVIADRRLWDRDDFYTEAVLKKVFGNQSVEIDTDVPGALEFRINAGFKNLLIPRSDDRSRYSGVDITAFKHVVRPELPRIQGAAQMSNYKTRRQVSVTLSGTSPDLDFKNVLEIFGAGWQRDRGLENQRFEAIAREPFNPPPPQSTEPMGNAIITYTSGALEDQQELSLYFDGNGKLGTVLSTTRYYD